MDVAVVGAGVAGCYCAYRLASRNVGLVNINEANDRVGGRLWSLALEGSNRQVFELGGTFFSTLQANVHGLISKELRLPCSSAAWVRDCLFFRGRHLSDASFSDPEDVPFSFEAPEAGRNPHAILDYVLARIVPDLSALWPLNQRPPTSSAVTYRHLQSVRHRGRRLHECGFWNVLSDVASNEAYELLTRSIGSISIFRNANAFDAIWHLLRDLAPQEYFRVDAGYQSLAERLWSAPSRQIARHLEHRLTRIDRKADRFSFLHGVDNEPAPSGALFVNWERYGGGWHAWHAGTRSWRARDQIRTPGKNRFVCGEAYAERHGWVEGALNSSEMVIRHFGIGRPAWVNGTSRRAGGLGG